MPFTVEERDTSRTITSGANPAVELRFVVRGTGADLQNDEGALGALEDEAPDEFLNLPRRDVRLEPAGPGLWDGEASYAPVSNEFEPPQTGESVFAFDTGGGTQHITQSKDTVSSHAPSGSSAPDFGGAIGVTADGVEGVDITVPIYQFSETHYLADSVVTPAYRGTLFYLTGKVNNGSFRGLAPGECLFLGASGSKRGEDDWEITFRFAGSPNVTGLTVGPISGINKKGWEYMWVRYADSEDTTAKVLVKKPVAVYIEKVYESASFTGLGIGS